MTPRSRDRYVAIAVPLGADVVEWVDARIREGDAVALESLAALLGPNRHAVEAIDAARDVQRDRDRDRGSDPGEPPPSAA